MGKDAEKSKLVSMSKVLTPDELAVVTLIYGEAKFTQSEVAEEMGWSQPTVSRLLESAVSRMRDRFNMNRDNIIIDF